MSNNAKNQGEPLSSPLKTAINLLCNQVKINPCDIANSERLVEGYSNDSYKIDTTSSGSYFVRIGRPCAALDRDIEGRILKALTGFDLDVIYYDVKTGNQIRRWIDGVNPTEGQLTSVAFYDLLAVKIKQLHSIDLSATLKKEKMDYHLYDAYWNALDSKYHDLFKQILDQQKDQPMVFSHNDLTPWNVIYDDKNQHLAFIDYEWAAYNWPVFDVANFVRDANIHHTDLEKRFLSYFSDEFSYDDLLNFIFVSCCYSYLWTYSVPATEQILGYRNRVFDKLVEFYNEITDIKFFYEDINKIWKKINQHQPWIDEIKTNEKYELTPLSENATNQSYRLRLDENHDYVIRIGNSEIQSLNRENEASFVKHYPQLVNHRVLRIDSKNGNSINRYLDGNTPSALECHTDGFINALINALEKIHTTPVKKDTILTIDWHAYQHNEQMLEANYYQLFNQIIGSLNPKDYVLTHGDCTPWNMVYYPETNQVQLIDFEWVRLNHRLFDYANFVREAELVNSPTEAYLLQQLQVEKIEFHKLVYLSAVYAYLYMVDIHSYPTYEQYIKKQLKLIKHLYNEITK